MSRKNTLPVHLPAALAMLFGAPGRADPLLLRPPTISAAELPTLCKPWRKALQDGVAAAVAHDHDLFAHIPDAHDPDSLRGDYTDSPLVSPWIARNVERQLPSLDATGVYRLTQTLWLLQWPDEREGTVWEVIVPILLNDLPRAAFWAGAMVASFARLEDGPRNRKRLAVDVTGRCGLEIGIRQTPFGIWALRQRTPSAEARAWVRDWMRQYLIDLVLHLGEQVSPFDIPEDHRLFEVPLMLDRWSVSGVESSAGKTLH